jgi:hypothetical protein
VRDTPPAVEEQFRRMLLARSPAERLAIACDMFTAGRALAVAGLLATTPNLGGPALKTALLKRLYGPDLSPDDMERITALLVAT